MRLSTLVLVFFFACAKPKAEAPPEPASAVSVGAPLNLSKPDEARVMLDLAAARAAVQQKTQVDGAAPKTLGELGVRLNFPEDLNYNPATGEVKSRSYPQH